MLIHFLNVGCGNMTLIHFPDGTTLLYDCNVTTGNESRVLGYLRKAMGAKKRINIFANSHRDADHMRGVKKVHALYPIGKVWDSGVEGTTTDTPEYRAYMDLRRKVGSKEVEARKRWDYGDARLRCMNSKNPNLSDANDQSLVFKIEYAGRSLLLAGDTSFRPWKENILPSYGDDVKAAILLASHHGSKSFFDDPSDEKNWYVAHIKKIKPAMTLVSVGQNPHGLPDQAALDLYEKHSTGSDKGNKVYTTQSKGNLKLTLTKSGGCSLATNQ